MPSIDGWVVPGLVDAHCHVGLDAHGAVDRGDQPRSRRSTDRDAGALLLRDAGSPADTRWIDDRDDLPRIIRAGRHIARTRRYIRNYAHEIEPERPAAYVAPSRPGAATAGSSWSATGSTATAGDLAPLWPADVARRRRSPAAHAAGRPGHRALLRRGRAAAA